MGGKKVLTDKTNAWKVAYGLIKVDGLKPTAEFDELVSREKKVKFQQMI